MNDYLISVIATMFGAAWRFAFGHDWKGSDDSPPFYARHARTMLHAVGAAFAALVMTGEGARWEAVILAAILTPAYFAIGNGSIIAGPDHPGGWAYARPMLLKYVAPAILAFVLLAGFGYLSGVVVAGPISALAYWLFYEPFKVGADPWNVKSEAASGAAWFGALSVSMPCDPFFPLFF